MSLDTFMGGKNPKKPEPKKDDHRAEILQLEKDVRRHDKLYRDGTPELSDAEFDALSDRLKALDPKNPFFTVVGKDDSSAFVKRSHLMPMGSQQKATDPAELIKWAAKYGHAQYIVEMKCDGISIELQYEKGLSRYSITRGDGAVGDDVTPNVQKMHGFVATVADDFTGSVRGEILMAHDIFAKKYPDQANCRNLAAGISKRKDGKGSEDLLIKVYDAQAVAGTPSPFDTELTKLDWLRAQGFDVVDTNLFATAQDVVDYRDSFTPAMRKALGYDIDGFVVKGDSIDLDDMKRDRPMRQIAFKFPVQEAVSVLKAIEWSESGAHYTPVATIDPIIVSGATIRRASLANPDLIKKLGIKIGDHVLVSRRGDVIPKIEKVVSSPPTATAIVLPMVCNTCKAKLVNDGTSLYCPNMACEKKAFHRLRKWLDTVGVKDIGDALLQKLWDKKLVRKVADFYALTPEKLKTLDGVAEGIATRTVTNLKAHTKIPLWTFIAGFDIEGVGEKVVEKVVKGGLDKLSLIHDASVADLQKIMGGDVIPQKLHEGVTALYNDMLDVYKTKMFTIVKPAMTGTKLKGQSFCVTGSIKLFKNRDDLHAKIEENGGEVKTSVTKGLTALITNDASSGSEKAEKAKALGIPVINEQQFMDLVK